MNRQTSKESTNRETYGKPAVLDYYDGLNELFHSEKVLFEKLSQQIENSEFLDIGIGGGRTTRYLLPMTRDYTGVDYVPKYIELAREKFNEGKFLVGDARNLEDFEDGSFDFVLFSYNGLDAVSYADRLKALREIRRVLRKAGTFMFSSHNRDYRYFNKPYWVKDARLNARLVKNLFSYLFFLPKHLWMKRREVWDSKYTIINDSDHRYSFLVYYTGIKEQTKQLEEIGFSNIEAYNDDGELVTVETESFWVYYTAVK